MHWGDFNVTCFPSERLGEPVFVQLWWSFQISFLSKGSWTFLLWVVRLCGLAIGTLPHGLELTNSLD